jgi:YebC/PmpR family DNA-binding regulatory protein
LPSDCKLVDGPSLWYNYVAGSYIIFRESQNGWQSEGGKRMSGHSKWSTIKRKKQAEDAKRGQVFTKLGRELMVAAREGGGDPDVNFKLRLVIDKARAANMPKDNIERAIRRGAGLDKGETLEEITYEGYGPNGVALLVQVVTDNRNRAVADIRRQFNRHGGSLGESGCVAWLFEPRGYIVVAVDDRDPEELFDLAVEAGADDVEISDNLVEIYTAPDDFQWVREFLQRRNVGFDTAEIYMAPKNLTQLDEQKTMKAMSLIEALEELDDVQQVYSNLDISDEIMVSYEAKT